MKNLLASLLRSVKADSGVTAIEYGLLAALAGVAIIGSLLTLGPEININFDTIATSFDGTPSAERRPPAVDVAGKGGGADGGTVTGGGDGQADTGENTGGGADGAAPGAGQNGPVAAVGNVRSGSSGASGGKGDGAASQDANFAQTFTAAGTLDSGSGSLAGGAGSPSATGSSVAPGSDVSGAPDTVVGLTVPMMDGGANESWALAPEKAAAAGSAGEGRRAGDKSGGLSDVSRETINWLGLLVLLVALFLMGANFRRAVQGAERKRQMQEWRDAKADKGGVIDLGAFSPGIREAA
ncbi:MAG: Flp family type IVb pilin [Alphaproteobacteria bacterium]